MKKKVTQKNVIEIVFLLANSRVSWEKKTTQEWHQTFHLEPVSLPAFQNILAIEHALCLWMTSHLTGERTRKGGEHSLCAIFARWRRLTQEILLRGLGVLNTTMKLTGWPDLQQTHAGRSGKKILKQKKSQHTNGFIQIYPVFDARDDGM